MTAEKWRPNAAEIAAHTKAMLGEEQVTHEAALEGLRKIREALRREYQLSDEELKPISELIAELDPSH